MQLEKQVCSLELSKRLKELGIAQDNSFYWVQTYSHKTEKYEYAVVFSPTQKEETRSTDEIFSAFTVAELGEMLPAGISERRNGNNTHETAVDVSWDLNISPKWGKNDTRYVLYLSGDNHYVQDDSEANARAKMLIYLLENKLISNE